MPHHSAVRVIATVAACVVAPAVLTGATHPAGLAQLGVAAEYALHATSYFVFMVLAYLATLSLRKAGRWAVALAVLDEAAQLFIVTRCQPGVTAWLMDAAGILVACMVITRHRHPAQRRMTWQV